MKDYLGNTIREGDIIHCAQRQGNVAVMTTRKVWEVKEDQIVTVDPDTSPYNDKPHKGRMSKTENCLVDFTRRS